MGPSEEQLSILSFEREYPRDSPRKRLAIRERFDHSATRYYQRLNQVIRTRKALAAEPLLVRSILDRIGGHKMDTLGSKNTESSAIEHYRNELGFPGNTRISA